MIDVLLILLLIWGLTGFIGMVLCTSSVVDIFRWSLVKQIVMFLISGPFVQVIYLLGWPVAIVYFVGAKMK